MKNSDLQVGSFAIGKQASRTALLLLFSLSTFPAAIGRKILHGLDPLLKKLLNMKALNVE